jgi:hypothetical protein
MTKSTKIVAALGVIAGLGIAALPAGSIFADELVPFSYTGAVSSQDVTVRLRVSEAVAVGAENTRCATTAATPDETENGQTDVVLTVKATGSCTHKIAGGTNGVYGFTMTVIDKDETTALTRDGAGGTGNSAIEAVAGTLGGSTWQAGWNLTGGNLTAVAVKPSTGTADKVIVTNEAKDVQVNMTYNFATKNNQETGKYKDTIVYTVAANGAAVSTGVTQNTVNGYIEVK